MQITSCACTSKLPGYDHVLRGSSWWHFDVALVARAKRAFANHSIGLFTKTRKKCFPALWKDQKDELPFAATKNTEKVSAMCWISMGDCRLSEERGATTFGAMVEVAVLSCFGQGYGANPSFCGWEWREISSLLSLSSHCIAFCLALTTQE